MNVPSEDSTSSESAYAERIRLGTRRLQSETVAVRLQVRRLKFPVSFAPAILEFENHPSAESTAGVERRSDTRNLIHRAVKFFDRFQRRACRIWRSMSLPFPDAERTRLIPIPQIEPFDGAMHNLCADFQQQAKQPL